jgi:hypothetical protein
MLDGGRFILTWNPRGLLTLVGFPPRHFPPFGYRTAPNLSNLSIISHF